MINIIGGLPIILIVEGWAIGCTEQYKIGTVDNLIIALIVAQLDPIVVDQRHHNSS